MDASPDTIALAERLGAVPMVLQVLKSSEVSKNLRLLELSGDSLTGLSIEPGQDVMVRVGHKANTDGAKTAPVRRRYTVLDPALAASDGRVAILVGLHENGRGSGWAVSAKHGDLVEAVGPRGKITARSANAHVFMGDATFIGAARAISGSLPTEEKADVILGVQDESDAAALDWSGNDADVEWIIDAGDPAGLSAIMWMRFLELRIKPGEAHIYVGGEFGLVSGIRERLSRAGFDSEGVSAKPYWRSGLSNQDHGEPLKD